MLEEVKSKYARNKNFKYFILYSIAFIIHGSTVIGLGPLIPYLAEYAHKTQTDYAFLFFYRALGFLTSGFFIKYLITKFTLHHLSIMLQILGGLALIWFTYTQSVLWQAITTFLGSLFLSGSGIAVNIGMMTSHQRYDQQFWLQLNHGMFTIGGLVGPTIIYFFERDSFIVLGLLSIAVAPFFYLLETPQSILYEGVDQHKFQKQSGGLKQVPKSIQYKLWLIFIIYIGLQATFAGWIASYTVLQGLSTKQAATSYSLYFSIAMSIFRLALAFITGKIQPRINRMMWGAFLTLAIASGLIILNMKFISVLWTCIALGLFLAPLFPLLLTVPSQYQMRLSDQQISNIMILASLGQAILSIMIGYLMSLISPDMLFYGLAFYALCQLILFLEVVKQFQQQSNKQQLLTGTQLTSIKF